MKIPHAPRPFRAGLAGLVGGALLAPPTAHASASKTITVDRDSVVDTLVVFPYQGLNANLWVNYDPIAGPNMSRSYLRFPLSSISPVANIVSATLKLNCNYVMPVSGGGTVEVYRSANDSWPENGINFGNQPGWTGSRLALANINSPGTKSINLMSLGNWYPQPDINDGYLTVVVKTLESSSFGAVRFDSLQGFSPATLVITVRNPGEILNPDMEDDLSGHQTSGGVSVIVDPGDPSNHVALLQTASPASLWQTIDTPDGPFALEFAADFLSPTGTFTVWLGDTLLYSVTAPESPRGGTTMFDPALQNLVGVDLKFTLDGPDGVTSRLILDDLSISPIPHPAVDITPDATHQNLTLSFFAEPGGWYDIESSQDAVNWDPHGRRIGGLDLLYEESLPVTNPRQFFRLQYVPYSEPDDIFIPNQEFEQPALGDNGATTTVANWTSTGGAGIWNPPASVYPESMFEGSNVAYVHNGHSLSQQLTEVLEPYRLYIIDALVGKRPDLGFPTASPPDLVLRAGGVELTPYESESPVVPAGTFEPWWRRYRIGRTHPQLGQPLEIILEGGTSGSVSQVNFDTVILEIE